MTGKIKGQDGRAAQSQRKARPYINLLFRCCNVYVRIYLNAQGTAFSGHCPRCCARARIAVDPEGDAADFWVAG